MPLHLPPPPPVANRQPSASRTLARFVRSYSAPKTTRCPATSTLPRVASRVSIAMMGASKRTSGGHISMIMGIPASACAIEAELSSRAKLRPRPRNRIVGHPCRRLPLENHTHPEPHRGVDTADDVETAGFIALACQPSARSGRSAPGRRPAASRPCPAASGPATPLSVRPWP